MSVQASEVHQCIARFLQISVSDLEGTNDEVAAFLIDSNVNVLAQLQENMQHTKLQKESFFPSAVLE